MLIFEVDIKGKLVIKEMLEDNIPKYAHIAFIGNDPRLEKKNLTVYPVFGGHWKVKRLTYKTRFDDVVICNDNIISEVFRCLQHNTRMQKIMLRKIRFQLDEVGPIETKGKILQSQFNFFAGVIK